MLTLMRRTHPHAPPDKQGNLPGTCAGFKNTYTRALSVSNDNCGMSGSQTSVNPGICKEADNGTNWKLICPS